MTGTGREAAASLRAAVEDLAQAGERSRHRRRRRAAGSFTLAVLGIDGSGKSTLARALAREISTRTEVCLISDRLERFAGGAPDELQPLLTERVRLWLGRKAKRAKSLAAYKIPKLSEMFLRDRLLEDTQRWYAPGAVVLDGSPLLNLAAWAVLYREENLSRAFAARALGVLSGREHPRRGDPLLQGFPEMRLLHDLGLTRLRVPDAVIWIDLEPATAVARIDARGERKQVHETEDKLARLRAAYAMVGQVIEHDWKLPYVRLKGEQPPEELVRRGLAFAAEAWPEENRHDG
jgi:adenylate kinase family enzyme